MYCEPTLAKAFKDVRQSTESGIAVCKKLLFEEIIPSENETNWKEDQKAAKQCRSHSSVYCLHVPDCVCYNISSPADDGVEDLTSLFYHVFDFIEVSSYVHNFFEIGSYAHHMRFHAHLILLGRTRHSGMQT